MPGQRDFDRALDLRGQTEAAGIAAIMAVNGFVPAIVLCSQAVRCVETLKAVETQIDHALSVRYCLDLYAGSHEDYVDLIASADGANSVLVIGHNPMMEDTAHALCCRANARLSRGFPTGGLAVIDLPGSLKCARAGNGIVTGFLTPQDC